MIICPECSAPLQGLNAACCSTCGFEVVVTDGVSDFIAGLNKADEFSDSYVSNYEEIAEVDLDASVMDPVFVQALADNLIDRVGPIHGLNVCDVGSGKGYAAKGLLSAGAASVTTVDISRAYLRRLTGITGIRPVLANAEQLPFDNEFDVIVSTDVLEHVVNAASFMYCINRALKPDGRFFVRVPYRESLMQYTPHLGCPYAFVHLRTFDKSTLSDCLTNAGFKVMRLYFDGYFSGRPQHFWRNRLTGRYYNHAIEFSKRRFGVSIHETQLPMSVARLLMEPTTVMAVAKKVTDLPQSSQRSR